MDATTPVALRETLRPEDAVAIESLVRATGKFNAEEVQIARELAQEALGDGAAAEYHFLLAEMAGRLVGYTCYGTIRGSDRRYEIFWIAVQCGLQGRGLGKTLMAETECRIRKRGGRRVYVETSSREEYLATQRFYRSCGYELAAHIEGYYDDADGLLVYAKRIEASPDAQTAAETDRPIPKAA